MRPFAPTDRAGRRDWIFLAMAHQAIGETAAARRWLETLAARPPRAGFHGPWGMLEIELLRREAEALIRSDTLVPADPFAQ